MPAVPGASARLKDFNVTPPRRSTKAKMEDYGIVAEPKTPFGPGAASKGLLMRPACEDHKVCTGKRKQYRCCRGL
jgi:hypothetical protein